MVGCWRKTADDWAIRDCAAVSYRQLDCEKNIGGEWRMVEEEYTVSGYRSTYLRTKTSSSTSRPVAICAIALLAYAVPPITKFILHAHFFVRLLNYLLQFGRCSFSFLFCSSSMVFSFYFYKKTTVRACVPQMSQIPNCGRQSVS